MPLDPLAGTVAPADRLANIPKLVAAYFREHPDANEPTQRVSFGTSGHRGSALAISFNEDHILAITQAICEHRASQGITGPLFLGIDTHALSECAAATALEVLAGNNVHVMVDVDDGFTPTPVVSHAILSYNRGRVDGLADGIVVTPSHNPPEDGGFKYNPPSGGPADTAVTSVVQARANELLGDELRGVQRMQFARARSASTTHRHDFRTAYVQELGDVIDMAAIRDSDASLGVDPLGGASVHYWHAIAEAYDIPLTVVSTEVDPTFRFMSLDWDGRIRMDCSSPYAMRRLMALQGEFDVAWACDPDADRHGIVSRHGGLMNPNHFLAVAIGYLFDHRPQWPAATGIGKTIVSSSIIDRVVQRLGRPLREVPVGFKWFVEGLVDGSLGFVGEESAGATLLRRDGTVWTTDKDGLALGLLAAEITAVTGKDPGTHYQELTAALGAPFYERIDAVATPAEKTALGKLSANNVHASLLAGDHITGILTEAPGNGAPIGGVKVVTDDGWFAARPSGTENVYKLYAESFRDPDHLRRIQEEAQAIIGEVLQQV